MSDTVQITLGAGRSRPQGRRTTIAVAGSNRVSVVAQAIGQAGRGVEAYWSPHLYRGDYRSEENWESACGIPGDIDYYDEHGEHVEPPPELRARIDEIARAARFPGNVYHGSTRGIRLVAVFDARVTNGDAYRTAGLAFAGALRNVLAQEGLLAQPPDPAHTVEKRRKHPGGGLWVDEAVSTDRARMLFGPHANVNGVQRDFEVVVVRDAPSTIADVLALEQAPVSTAPPGTKARAQSTTTTSGSAGSDIGEAADNWLRDHPREYPKSGTGACPVCDCKCACWGQLPNREGKWWCWNTDHPDTVGHGTDRGYFGDALDLQAHARGCSRAEVLREDGYLAPQCGATTKNHKVCAATDLFDDAKCVWHSTTDAAKAKRKADDAAKVEASRSDYDDSSEAIGKPTIVVGAELAETVDATEAALLAMLGVNLFTRGTLLVRIARDAGRKIRGLTRDTDMPVIGEAPVEFLRELAARAARFVRLVKRGDNWAEQQITPPMEIAKTLRARDELRFPPIEGVVECPTLRPDGSVLDTGGYDASTGLYYERGGVDYPQVPRDASHADAVRAYERLCDPFADFPFVEKSDLSAAVAAVLSIVGRPAIVGPVPAFPIRATAPGTGKGLCAYVITLIGTGRMVPVTAAPRDDDEMKKSILAIGLEGSPVVLLDNIEGSIGSPNLAAALTSSVFKGRVLGVSRNATVTLRAVWLMTGNGITFRGDLGRRVVPIDLDPRCEFPEDRRGFRYTDLLAHVRAKRPQLLADALTMLVAYVRAGRPAHGKPRKGSYEAWDDLVRGTLIWVGAADPLAGVERVRREGDSDLGTLRAVVAAWASCFGESEQTVATAVKRGESVAELREALALLDPRGDGTKLNGRVIGRRLAGVRGRIVDGKCIERGRDYQGQATWKVVSP